MKHAMNKTAVYWAATVIIGIKVLAMVSLMALVLGAVID